MATQFCCNTIWKNTYWNNLQIKVGDHALKLFINEVEEFHSCRCSNLSSFFGQSDLSGWSQSSFYELSSSSSIVINFLHIVIALCQIRVLIINAKNTISNRAVLCNSVSQFKYANLTVFAWLENEQNNFISQ